LARSRQFAGIPIADSLWPVIGLSVITLLLSWSRGELIGTRIDWIPVNLALAWIPYVLGVCAVLWARALPRYAWVLLFIGVGWLLFFPNAPYLVTDLIHIRARGASSAWYDMLLLSSLAFAGLVLAMASLRTVQRLVEAAVGRAVSWVMVPVIIYLASVGVYMGRFLRWNSWDALSHPGRIVRDVLTGPGAAANSGHFAVFTLAFAATQLTCYLGYALARRGTRSKGLT
jgi:uncharacterized membrane protein